MIGTQVLNHQTHILLPREKNPNCFDLNLKLREQECLSMLKSCTNMKDLKFVHTQMVKLGILWKSQCASKLLATCVLAHWGTMDYACSIFRVIEEPSSYAFNAMIRGHVERMSLDEAILVYCDMLHECGVEPDKFTYPILLKACAGLGAVEEGIQVHGQLVKLGFDVDLFVQNSLINFYGKCGERKLACQVFGKMSQRSVASWSSIISAHATLGLWSECLGLFGDMSREGNWRVEESMLVSVLSSCTHLGALDLGRCAHGSLIRNMRGSLNVIVDTSLVDMYVKCGSMEKGFSIFQKMVEKNQLSYSVMISGLAAHGRGHDALRVFSEMLEEGLEPDEGVYVGVLTACSHMGLVNEGRECFDRMRFKYGVKPTVHHYGCMIDLMGRAGLLSEAIKLIESMPIEPNDVVWRTLLSASKVHHDLTAGELAAKNLFELNPNNASDYLVLSNMYARAQRWEDVAMIRTKMAQKGLTQVPGCSMVEVKRKMYKFVSHDKSEPQCRGVYEMIHQMEWQLKFEGYSPDITQVLFDVDEEEKRHRLRYHSQKLAIAFALIHTSHGSPIKIDRNLRMCSDCHTYTKFISSIFKRRISVRDRNRFHHFIDGTCSCRDYW